MRRGWQPLLITLLVLLALTLSACADDGNGTETTVPGNGDTETTVPEEPTTEDVAPPGLYEIEDGTVQAVGILNFRDLEGGFWAVVDTVDPEEADEAEIVAVLGPTEEIPAPIGSFEGRYVSVVGERRDASVYQAGPFVEIMSIEVITPSVIE